MPSGSKCVSGGFLGKGGGGAAAGSEPYDAAAKEYQAKLDANCDDIIESSNCMAKEVRKINKLITDIRAMGQSEKIGTSNISALVQYTAQQAIAQSDAETEAAVQANMGEAGTAAGVKGALAGGQKKGQQLKETAQIRDISRNGTNAFQIVTGAQGSKVTPDIESNTEDPANQTVLKDVAEGWTRGMQTSNRSGYKYAVSGAATTGFDYRGLLAAECDEMQKIIDQLIPIIRDYGEDVDPLLRMKAKIAELKTHTSKNSQMSKCAEKLDQKANIELDTKRGYLIGATIAGHNGGTPQERSMVGEGISHMTGDEIMSVAVINYKEQCILLSQISTLAKYSRSLDNIDVKTSNEEGEKEIRRRLPYTKAGGGELVGNAPLLIEGESFGLMNRLTTSHSQATFFNMSTAEISSMQPLIRLYKIKNANSSAPVSEVEIPFDSHAGQTDIKNIFKNKNKRGFGIGIKSFNLNFEGQDMFAQKRCITATLSLQAADFEELMRDRTVETVNSKTGRKETHTFKYIDLALKTGKNIKQKDYKQNDALNFRLKAVFGWARQDGVSPIKGDAKKALNNSFVSVNLTPVTHTFDFDELGRVTFNIEYLAYVEEYFATPRLNIFTEVSTNVRLLTRKLAFDNADYSICMSGGGGDDLQKTVNQIKQDDVKIIEQEKQKMHSHLFKQLFINGYIHFLNFTREDLKSVLAQGPGYPLAGKVTKGSEDSQLNLSQEVHAAFSSQIDDDKENDMDLGAALQLAGMDSIQIPFFYIADMLNVVMGSMEQYLSTTADELTKATEYKGLPVDSELRAMEIQSLKKTIAEFKKFRVVLGPLEIVDHATGDSQHVNFGDVPVSVKYFSEWLTSKLLKKNIAQYPLTQFLKDLFNDLLKNYLNEDSCYPFSIKQKVRLYEAVVTSYPSHKGNRDEITARILGTGNKYHRLTVSSIPKLNPLLNLKGNSDYNNPNPGVDKEMNYFIFHAGRTMPLKTMRGKKVEDEPRGIMHYVLGRDRGLIKNISLEKTETPHLKTVRFEQDGYDGLHQLRELYDVNIKSYANVGAFPGQYVYVDPKGFAPSMAGMDEAAFDLTDLGVGGYYMITRASHDFAPGVGETNLTAVWVASAGGKGSQASGVGTNKKTKCRKGASQEATPAAESEPEKPTAPSDPPADS